MTPGKSFAPFRKLAMGAAVALAASLHAPRAAAQISDCSNARAPVPGAGPQDVVFKLMLDELAGTDDAGDAEIVHRALLSKLQDNFDKARLELGRFHVVLCLGRSPVQVSDIMADVSSFARYGVVLETWGYFDGDEATLYHAFVPLLAPDTRDWRPAVDHVRTSYAYVGGGELAFLKSLVAASPEVRIFAALGAASAAYAAQDFDSARTYFCRTLLMLRRFPDGDGLHIALLDRQTLDAFLEQMSLRVIDDTAAARAAGAYDGPLGSPIIPAGTRCNGAGL